MILKEEHIGNQRLLLGDCGEVIGGLEFDAICTDPPYGIGAATAGFIGTKKRKNAKCAPRDYGHSQWDDLPADMGWFDGATPAVVWGGNFLAMPPTKRWLIWDKVNDGMGLADCEIAWTNTDGAIRLFRHEWVGFRRGSEQGLSRHHPTQKPVALMEWCLGFLPDAKTILDPYMGSGTTLVACQRMGRHGTGIELDPDYFRIACQRGDEAARQPDLLIPETRTQPVQQGLDQHSRSLRRVGLHRKAPIRFMGRSRSRSEADQKNARCKGRGSSRLARLPLPEMWKLPHRRR